MRFVLKCIVVLAILYRAILVTQGEPAPAALATAALSDAASTAQAAVGREMASRVDSYCRGDPAACLADAARLTGLFAASDVEDATRWTPGEAPALLRRRQHGAMAAATR